jgi:hypothetical protein
MNRTREYVQDLAISGAGLLIYLKPAFAVKRLPGRFCHLALAVAYKCGPQESWMCCNEAPNGSH